MAMMEKFTGYIDLNGKHVKDGLVTRPKAFSVLEDERLVELRWITTRGDKRYEISKKHQLEVVDGRLLITPTPDPFMKIGIRAGEEFARYIDEKFGHLQKLTFV